MTPALRAVIFDLDGTLGDTLPICYGAFRAVFRRYLGRDLTDAEIRATFGPSEEGVIRRHLPDADPDEALRLFLETYASEHDARVVVPFPGVPELLAELDRRAVRLGLVTGKGAQSAAISLERLGLAPRFPVVEAGSADGAVKPVAIRRLLRDWAIAPHEAAYVGDAPNDVKAARETGVAAVAAVWAPGAEPERLAALQPDVLCRSVAECAAWLLTRL